MGARLDTNILVKPDGNATLAGTPAPSVFLSLLNIDEIVKGIPLPAVVPKETHLTDWLAGIEDEDRERSLPIDAETTRI